MKEDKTPAGVYPLTKLLAAINNNPMRAPPTWPSVGVPPFARLALRLARRTTTTDRSKMATREAASTAIMGGTNAHLPLTTPSLSSPSPSFAMPFFPPPLSLILLILPPPLLLLLLRPPPDETPAGEKQTNKRH